VAETAKALATPVPFEFEGITYQVAQRNLKMEGAFEVWLEERARLAVARHQRHMSAAEYEAHLAGWRRECAAGTYSFGQALAIQAWLSEPGSKYMAFLQLAFLPPIPKEKEPQEPVTMHTIDRIWADPTKLEELFLKLSWAQDPLLQRLRQPDEEQPQPTTSVPVS
jgi:hypothetical protein